MSKRLFLGLELPESCRTALSRIDPQLKNVRWIQPAQMHLTLGFIGSADATSEEALIEALDAISLGSFFLPLQGVGSFGGSRPSVLWAGVGKGHPHLFALHKHVQDAILRAGLKPDLRAFHPHVTLARLKDVSANALRPFLREHAERDFGMFEVKDLVLFSSRAFSTGSIYTAEYRRALGGPS
jgi:2'-5' RNA ligase